MFKIFIMQNGLNQNINNQEEIKKQLEEKQKNENYNDPIRQIESRFLNFSNSTKWFYYIPVGYIFRQTTKFGENLQVPINCKGVQFPQFKIQHTNQPGRDRIANDEEEVYIIAFPAREIMR